MARMLFPDLGQASVFHARIFPIGGPKTPRIHTEEDLLMVACQSVFFCLIPSAFYYLFGRFIFFGREGFEEFMRYFGVFVSVD